MSKMVNRSAIGLLIIFMFISAGCKGDIKKQSIQGEIASGGDQYIIGPEDVLQINVWKEQALSVTARVRVDGNISVPLINEVQAAGLTPLQLQERLTQKLKEFVEDPNVSVMVMEANSFRVYVSGEVKTPGMHLLRRPTSLLQIIPMAGGFSDWANPKKIMIIRQENGKENRMRVNYKKMMNGEIPVLILKPGDTIIVP